MIIGVPREVVPSEARVALVPAGVAAVLKLKDVEVLVERGAGEAAGFPDGEYEQRGAKIVERGEVWGRSDLACQVWCRYHDAPRRDSGRYHDAPRRDLGPGASGYQDDDSRRGASGYREHLRAGLTVVGHCDPLGDRDRIEEMARTGVTSFAMELMPRITRAQSMDALSSQATIAGYKAVILAADHLPKMFPMLMTAAGTVAAAKVLVIGAGVAGLQAIATARRLGGVVSAYDVRPAVKEQVQSLGARFVELELETQEAEGAGGYAKAMDEEFYRNQRELLGKVVAECDVVITTAAVPGKRSPVLVTREMVEQMRPGSVIVDLAAERGGNCELTKADESIVEQGVRILGPTNLPATVPHHASQMYSRNIEAFVKHLLRDGTWDVDQIALDADEIVRETLLTHGGVVVHPRLREKMEAGAGA